MLKFDRLLYVTVNWYMIQVLLKPQLIQIKTDCYKLKDEDDMYPEFWTHKKLN